MSKNGIDASRKKTYTRQIGPCQDAHRPQPSGNCPSEPRRVPPRTAQRQQKLKRLATPRVDKDTEQERSLPAGARTGTAPGETSVGFSRSGPPTRPTQPPSREALSTHPLAGALPEGRRQTCDGPRVGRARAATGDWRTRKHTEEHVQTMEPLGGTMEQRGQVSEHQEKPLEEGCDLWDAACRKF